jgi:hypothetical protein
MATTKTELYNNGTLVATKTSAPFNTFDWTPASGEVGSASLTVKRYEDGVLVATSAAVGGTVDAPASSSDPSGLTNLHLWYDATDASTVTADGSNVISSFADKTAVKTLTATGSPKYLNSEIQFRDTALQYLQNSTASTVVVPDVDFHGFIIFKSPTTGNGNLFSNRDASTNITTIGINGGNLSVYTIKGGSALSKKSVAFSETANYHKLEFKSINNVVTAYLDDVEMTGSATPATPNPGIAIGDNKNAKSSDFKEMFVKSGEMTAQERTDMLSYISSKYSL